jgi:hypothetical protein
MMIGAEAAAQASGALGINGELTECIYLRAIGRGMAEDFGGAMLDLGECARRDPGNKRYEEGRKRLKRDRVEAEKRERAIWKREGGKKMREAGYTFMGNDEGPGWRALVVGWARRHNVLVWIAFMFVFVLAYDSEKFHKLLTIKGDEKAEVDLTKALRDKGFTQEFIDNNPWLLGKGGRGMNSLDFYRKKGNAEAKGEVKGEVKRDGGQGEEL